MNGTYGKNTMKSTMNTTMNTTKNTATVRDMHLRLDQLKNGSLPAKNTPTLASSLYARAYDGYLHLGTVCNTLREGSDSEGGYLAPDEFEHRIIEALKERNVLRSLATVIQTKRLMKIPVAVGEGQAYWVPEEGPIPTTDCSFDQLQLDAHKLGCMVRVSDELLEDSAFDIEGYLARSFAERLATAEEDAFLDGDGNHKPLGLLRQLERTVETQNAGAITVDDVVDLQHAIPEPYRRNAVFLMSDAAVRELQKIRTAFDRNIWEDELTKGTPTKLLGVPIIVCDVLPAPESGTVPILYGDFSRFVIGDRDHRSVKRLNELYARTGQVGFKISQRVDALLMDKRAIAGLKVT